MARKLATQFDPVNVHVGKRIAMRRRMLGISQEKLGRAIGVSFQQIQKYETGANRVGPPALVAIAQALEVTPAFFFEGLDIATGRPCAGDAVVARFFALAGAAELARLVIAMPPRQRHLLLDLAGALAPANAARPAMREVA